VCDYALLLRCARLLWRRLMLLRRCRRVTNAPGCAHQRAEWKLAGDVFLLFGARVRLTGTCDVRAVGFFDLGQSVAGQVTRDLENEGK
jgi:hypothetical protein